jgi:hypothetical protein
MTKTKAVFPDVRSDQSFSFPLMGDSDVLHKTIMKRRNSYNTQLQGVSPYFDRPLALRAVIVLSDKMVGMLKKLNKQASCSLSSPRNSPHLPTL